MLRQMPGSWKARAVSQANALTWSPRASWSGGIYETCPATFGPETLVHSLHDFRPAPASPGWHLRVPVLLSRKRHLTWCRITIAKYHTDKWQGLNLAVPC